MEPGDQVVRGVVASYLEAWVNQDADLIITLFTETATYREGIFREPIVGHAGIRDYWETKVQKEQAQIACRLLNLYLDGRTAVAEWEAEFDDLVDGVRKHMVEIAILEFEGSRIKSLREYWTSKTLRQLPSEAHVAASTATRRRAKVQPIS